MSHLTSFEPLVTKWALSSRILHWVSALLLLITWVMIALYDNTDNGVYMGLHKAFGVSVLVWMLARVVNRFLTPAPPPLVMAKWQMLVAHATHFCLYALVIAMPLAGLLMSVYGGHAVDMFGVFSIPVFVEPNRQLARFFNDLHTQIIWPMLWVFTLVHIGAALQHHFIKKDGVLKRML